jgi:hypothetical protein
MEAAVPADPILELGKLLAARLEPHDVLGRWISHHVAELVNLAETAPEHQRAEAEARAREAILQLWEHRAAIPSGARPFESFEYAIAGLERLGDDRPWAYSRILDPEEAPDDTMLEANLYLKAALELERSIRDVLVACFGLASGVAQVKEVPWLTLSREIAETEELKAARQLAQLRRRLRLKDPADSVRTQADGAADADPRWTRTDVLDDQVPERQSSKASIRSALERLREQVDELISLADE